MEGNLWRPVARTREKESPTSSSYERSTQWGVWFLWALICYPIYSSLISACREWKYTATNDGDLCNNSPHKNVLRQTGGTVIHCLGIHGKTKIHWKDLESQLPGPGGGGYPGGG